jgi:hypothetical protein
MAENAQVKARAAALSGAGLNAWVALSDDETKLVARGETYQQVADALDKMGDDNAVILLIPPNDAPLAV